MDTVIPLTVGVLAAILVWLVLNRRSHQRDAWKRGSVTNPVVPLQTFAPDDMSALHPDAQNSIKEQLVSNESVKVVIPGAWDSAIVGTDRRAFVYKRGFMAGALGGKKLSWWDYGSINGVALQTGDWGAYAALEVPGMNTGDLSYWGSGSNSSAEAPNAISLDSKGKGFSFAEEGCRELRYLISVFQTPAGSITNSLSTRFAADEIEKLALLRDRGNITKEKFEAKKRQLLGL